MSPEESEYAILNLEGREVYLLRAHSLSIPNSGDFIYLYDELNNLKHVVVSKNVAAVLKKD